MLGWFIGWDLLPEYTAIVAVVAISISGYFSFLVEQVGITLPGWMLGAPGTETDGVAEGTYRVDLFAALLCLFIAWLLTRGMRSAAKFETILVGLEVAVVLLVIGVGVFYVRSDNFDPFTPFGLGGAVTGAATVFFAVAMSRDGLLPRWVAKTDAKHHVPARVTWIVGVASAVIAGFLPIGEAAALTNIGILLTFVVVCAAIVVLRRTEPDLPRGFRCPAVPICR